MPTEKEAQPNQHLPLTANASWFVKLHVVSAMLREEPGGVGGGLLIIMHGRSLRIVDPRIPAMLGGDTSGFHPPGRHCLHQTRTAMRCSPSRIKIRCILLRSWGVVRMRVSSFVEEIVWGLTSRLSTLRGSAGSTTHPSWVTFKEEGGGSSREPR